jgi:hypothetical protein
MTTTTTKHTCGGPAFGRRTAGCPRCDELAAGAEPRSWNVRSHGVVMGGARVHNCVESRCLSVCTFGDY